MRTVLDKVVGRLGYERRSESSLPFDVDPVAAEVLRAVAPFTRVPIAGLLAVRSAVQHVVQSRIEGSIVECGVWRGGTMMLAAQTLKEDAVAGRSIWLYDTFSGMPDPVSLDSRFDGTPAQLMLSREQKEDARSVWCVAQRADVEQALARTGYPAHLLQFVEGKIEDTVPRHVPDKIAILRIDVDWYEPTRHALEHLVPKVVPGGFVLLDDYGYWQGARRAVDEFLHERDVPTYLHRIDASGRLFIA